MNPEAATIWKAPRWALAVLLAVLGMLGPFSIDTYIPAFSGIAHSIGASPVEMQQTLSAYLFGFEPDAGILAAKMEIPEDKIRKIMKIAKEPISMETPIGDDDDSHLGDFIEDSTNTAPIDAAMQAALRDVVKDIHDSLTPREAKVLRMRFGIEMSTDHTLEEVGKQFDVTRERIRQIEAKALRKLKHPSRSDKLRSFIDTL